MDVTPEGKKVLVRIDNASEHNVLDLGFHQMGRLGRFRTTFKRMQLSRMPDHYPQSIRLTWSQLNAVTDSVIATEHHLERLIGPGTRYGEPMAVAKTALLGALVDHEAQQLRVSEE